MSDTLLPYLKEVPVFPYNEHNLVCNVGVLFDTYNKIILALQFHDIVELHKTD